MKDLCVAVLAFEKPEFLYATLDSIFRNKLIDEVDVNVYIDGGSTKLQEVKEVISEFNVNKVTSRIGNIKNFWSTVLALRDSFNMGYQKCLFMEDDHIIRTDTIDWCLNNDSKETLVSLSGDGSPSRSYRPRGCMISKEEFEKFDKNWVLPMLWVGTERQGVPIENYQILTYCECAFDNVMYGYLYYNNLLMDYAQKYYTAHFGIVGVNSVINDNESMDMYNKMFSGDKKNWVDNISNIITVGDYSDRFRLNLWYKKVFIYE